MGFLSNLFKRKPGGTVIGNLFRGVASAASGGILGNGAMMISQQDADKRDLTDADYEKKYSQTKAGVPVQAQTVVDPNTGQVVTTPATGVTFASKVKDFFKQPMVRLLLALASGIGIVILIIKLVRKKGGKRKGGY
jgi:hypothetical protein